MCIFCTVCIYPGRDSFCGWPSQEEFEAGDEAIKAVDAREKREAERKAAGEVEAEEEEEEEGEAAKEGEVSAGVPPPLHSCHRLPRVLDI